MSKSKKRRSQVLYPGLRKEYNLRVRRPEIDYDYLHKLSKEELEWLNKFSEEWVGAALKNDGKDFHKTKEERKIITDRNNARNRCLFTDLVNRGDKFNSKRLFNYERMLAEIEQNDYKEVNPTQMEDAYVDYLEFKEIEKMLSEYDAAMAKLMAHPVEFD